MSVSSCNNFIYFLSLAILAIPRMDTLFVYIQPSTFDQDIENRENIFTVISFVYFCSSLYFHNI